MPAIPKSLSEAKQAMARMFERVKLRLASLYEGELTIHGDDDEYIEIDFNTRQNKKSDSLSLQLWLDHSDGKAWIIIAPVWLVKKTELPVPDDSVVKDEGEPNWIVPLDELTEAQIAELFVAMAYDFAA